MVCGEFEVPMRTMLSAKSLLTKNIKTSIVIPKSILEVRRVLIEHLTQLRDEFRSEQLAKANSTNANANSDLK